ncbi:MAG TPA: RNA methyltransferase, partial [Candidatus Kapabacteria bacterium]|nr:RNA methyltransferase [Candidatus Kapabacteria bacterium]
MRKFIKTLHHKQTRDERGLFVAEGEKLVEELLKSSFQAEFIVVRESASSNIIDLADKFNERGIAVYTAPKHQFDQLCDTKTPQGILAVVNTREQKVLPKESFIALDGVSDPGNLGTIIRSADWFGIKQVIIGNAGVDGLNPKTVRSTM